MSLSFVFVSTKINQNIIQNISIEDFFTKDNKTTSLVNTWAEGDVWNNEKLVKDLNIFSLASWENINFTFSWITDFTWSISLKDWWPIYFETTSYKWSDSTQESILSSSGILSDSSSQIFTLYLNAIYNRVDLNIKNIWWNSSFYLEVDKKNTWTWSTKKYKITKTIWGKEVEKTIIEN